MLTFVKGGNPQNSILRALADLSEGYGRVPQPKAIDIQTLVDKDGAITAENSRVIEALQKSFAQFGRILKVWQFLAEMFRSKRQAEIAA